MNEATSKRAYLLARANTGNVMSFYWPIENRTVADDLEKEELIVYLNPYYKITDKGKEALVAYLGGTALPSKEPTATVEITAIAVMVVEEEKLADQQPLTDLLNALAAFELELEVECAIANRDYEHTSPDGSWGEALDWGHRHGITIAMNRWQNCKEAITKIDGES